MGLDAPWHWIVLIVLVVALFGYKKLPDASRALGRSLRIFKTEITGLTEDDKAREAAKKADAPGEVRTVTPPSAPIVDVSKPVDSAPTVPSTPATANEPPPASAP
jgi:sec-independent protein translocase protein TatA